MMSYSIEPRTRKHVAGYGFLSFARNLCNKYTNTENNYWIHE